MTNYPQKPNFPASPYSQSLDALKAQSEDMITALQTIIDAVDAFKKLSGPSGPDFPRMFNPQPPPPPAAQDHPRGEEFEPLQPQRRVPRPSGNYPSKPNP